LEALGQARASFCASLSLPLGNPTQRGASSTKMTDRERGGHVLLNDVKLALTPAGALVARARRVRRARRFRLPTRFTIPHTLS